MPDMYYQNVIKALQNKTLKVVENVNEHLHSDKKLKKDLNDLKDMLEMYKKFVGQWESLQGLLSEENTESWSLMAKVQRMKLLDREKTKMGLDFDLLKEKVQTVRGKMGSLCPTCLGVFNEVLSFIHKIERDGLLVRTSDRFPQNRWRKVCASPAKAKSKDKSTQADIPPEKTGLKTKVGQKVVKLAKQLDIVLM